MNTKKVEKNLRKINNLFATIREEGEASSIEKDLLKSYTRKLYDAILEEAEIDSPQKPASKVTKPTYSLEEKPQPSPVVKVEPEKPTPTVEAIVRKELHNEPTPVTPEPKPIVDKVVEEVIKEPTPAPAPPKKALAIDDDLKEIFEPIEITELSDRLSNAPIQDLTRQGFSINEKLFNISELFGGDSAYYQTVLERLNGFSSFDEAKQYLATGVAKDRQWGDPNKIKKATNFVRVVQRRYLG